MELMLKLYHGAKDIVSRAIPLSQLKETGIFESLAKMKYEVPNDGQEKFAEYDAPRALSTCVTEASRSL